MAKLPWECKFSHSLVRQSHCSTKTTLLDMIVRLIALHFFGVCNHSRSTLNGVKQPLVDEDYCCGSSVNCMSLAIWQLCWDECVIFLTKEKINMPNGSTRRKLNKDKHAQLTLTSTHPTSGETSQQKLYKFMGRELSNFISWAQLWMIQPKNEKCRQFLCHRNNIAQTYTSIPPPTPIMML